jgi:hypothetical protein
LIFGSVFAPAARSAVQSASHEMLSRNERRYDAESAEYHQLDNAMPGRLDFFNWS